MKRMFYISLFLLFCFASCNNNQETPKAENDVDAIRNFIQFSLYGDYDKAEVYMLKDSINEDRMKMIRALRLSPDEKRGLANASINIHNVQRVNDSTTIVIYSNSFKNNWDTLRALKMNGEWLVDFDYLFDHDTDTLMNKPVNTDSIK